MHEADEASYSQPQSRMTKPEIEYELHDSVILAISTGPRREVAFTIDLYSIFYPNEPRVQLRFGGIENFDAVQQYVDQLRAEANGDDIGCRIDAFQYDTKQESKTGDYWFFLQTDWCGAVRIHCSNMSMTEVQSPSCEQQHAPESDSNGESSPSAR